MTGSAPPVVCYQGCAPPRRGRCRGPAAGGCTPRRHHGRCASRLSANGHGAWSGCPRQRANPRLPAVAVSGAGRAPVAERVVVVYRRPGLVNIDGAVAAAVTVEVSGTVPVVTVWDVIERIVVERIVIERVVPERIVKQADAPAIVRPAVEAVSWIEPDTKAEPSPRAVVAVMAVPHTVMAICIRERGRGIQVVRFQLVVEGAPNGHALRDLAQLLFGVAYHFDLGQHLVVPMISSTELPVTERVRRVSDVDRPESRGIDGANRWSILAFPKVLQSRPE